MPRPSEPLIAKDCRNILSAKFLEKWSRVCFGSVFDATDPAYHEVAIAVEPLQVRVLRCRVWDIIEQTQTVYILPWTLGASCLVARNRGSQENANI